MLFKYGRVIAIEVKVRYPTSATIEIVSLSFWSVVNLRQAMNYIISQWVITVVAKARVTLQKLPQVAGRARVLNG